jgi:hypothetical protein
MQYIAMLYFLFNKKKKKERREEILLDYTIYEKISVFFGYYSLFHITLWIKTMFFFNFQFSYQIFIFCDLALLNQN